jgi:transcriptional regulator with XRE-family HTH domain
VLTLTNRKDASERFSRNLQKLMEQKGLSYEGLEKFTGVGYRSIARYVKGESSIPLDAADKLARHFGKTVDEMVEEDDV